VVPRIFEVGGVLVGDLKFKVAYLIYFIEQYIIELCSAVYSTYSAALHDK
jgi:hypothetical protein